jgi:aminoglycoside 6'-N-acetyltransferase I
MAEWLLTPPRGSEDRTWLALRIALWPEGLYVEPGARRRGVARALVESVVSWALEQGVTELASDSLIGNVDAHAAHRALGFEETERVVYFRRPLRRPP